MNFATVGKWGQFVRTVLSFSYFVFLQKDNELEILLNTLGPPPSKEW